jgi:hypothetical protein
MVGVTGPLTGAGAVMGATVQLTGVGAVVGATVQLGAMDITAVVGSFPGRSNRVRFTSHPAPRPHTNNVFVPEQGDDAAVRQIVQANSASPHFVGAAIISAKGKEPMESPPTVSRKQLTAESDSYLIIILTSSDDDNEHAKEEEYSDNDCGIFGPDSSSSDNDSTKHDDDDDIDSSDHDDQEEEAQASDDQEEEEVQADDDQEEEEAQAADDQEEEQDADGQQDDDLLAASSAISDMLEPEWRQQIRQEDQQANDKTMKQMRGLFDFSQEKFITLPEYDKATKFQFDISESLPPSSATTSTTTRPHPSRCTWCSPTRPMTTSCRSKQS